MPDEPKLVRIPLAAAKALSERESSDFSFFLCGPSNQQAVLYRNRGVGLSQPDFERLEGNRVGSLLVEAEAMGTLDRVFEHRLEEVLHRPEISPAQKAEFIQHVGNSVARMVASEPAAAESVTRASQLLDSVIDGLLGNPLVAAHLLHMSGHHRTTASHMFSVGTLAVMLGARVFGSDRTRLKQLGLAGMLHDLGKLSIDAGILNKVGVLEFAERDQIQQHPIESIRLIHGHPEVTPTICLAILQHHERIDGRGYPLGLTGDDLLPESKVLAIVDSFHAMIGPRAYRTPLSPREAMQSLSFNVGKQFDPEIFAVWTELFAGLDSSPVAAAPVSLEPRTPDGACHQEHRTVMRSGITGMRQPRFTCSRHTSVPCLYAGRLQHVHDTPRQFQALLHDVSCAGVCLRTRHPMYRGEIAHLQLNPGDSSRLWLRAQVAWCHKSADGDGFRTGFRFIQRLTPNQVCEEAPVQGISHASEVSTPVLEKLIAV